MSATILIVDDDPVQRRLLESAVNRMSHRAVQASGGEEAIEILSGPEAAKIKLVILDLVMPDLDGMGVLTRMRDMKCKVPVIVQTAQGGIDVVVSAMRAGAFDFIVKPLSPERLQVSVTNAMKLDAMEGAVRTIRNKVSKTLAFDELIAISAPMEKVISLGKRAAASNIPILIEGESGVGKEIVARAIQGSGSRKSKPFVTVNCGAIPENLVESILFGHEKGAFTGANDKHIGKFQEADGGTLFLDEVGELPPDIQVKLLRAIQEGEIDPVGSRKPVRVNFRLISATNRDMIQQVKQGEFREDLYYRLNVFPINVPALRERKADIAPLVEHFIARVSLEESRRSIAGIDNQALAMLESYDWPGNIRQLENAIFRAIVLCDDDLLTVNEFPQLLARMPDYEAVKPVFEVSQGEQMTAPNAYVSQPPYALVPLLNDKCDVRPMEEIEGDMIRFAIDHHDGRMTSVARSLGMGRSTLYRKLKELEIDPDDPHGEKAISESDVDAA